MNSQNNNNQIIAEKRALDKIEFYPKNPFEYYNDHMLDVIDPFVKAVKDGTISIDDMQRSIKAALKTFEYYNDHMLDVIDPFVKAVKDGIISIDDMQRGIKAALKTFEYYNEYMLELLEHGRRICPLFTLVRKERTEKE